LAGGRGIAPRDGKVGISKPTNCPFAQIGTPKAT